jgi:aminoglycoside phosphotransferase (APT) family kinase protein
VARDGRIAAIIDWEISTLGDPLADLAYCINAWAESPDGASGHDPPTLLSGFCGRQVLIDRYADQTGVDLSRLDYYRCFNHWKTVCILQGVYTRYLQGQKSTEDVDVAAFAERIDTTLHLAVAAADRVSL